MSTRPLVSITRVDASGARPAPMRSMWWPRTSTSLGPDTRPDLPSKIRAFLKSTVPGALAADAAAAAAGADAAGNGASWARAQPPARTDARKATAATRRRKLDSMGLPFQARWGRRMMPWRAPMSEAGPLHRDPPHRWPCSWAPGRSMGAWAPWNGAPPRPKGSWSKVRCLQPARACTGHDAAGCALLFERPLARQRAQPATSRALDLCSRKPRRSSFMPRDWVAAVAADAPRGTGCRPRPKDSAPSPWTLAQVRKACPT